MKSVAVLAAAVLAVGTGSIANAAEPSYDGALVPVSSVGTTTPLAKPTLRAGGPALIVSDSPEPLSAATALPGALYRDQVEGLVRVLGHQQNNRTTPVQNSVAVTNTGHQPLLLFSRGAGAAVNLAPDVAGQQALDQFLASHHAPRYIQTLAPGETYWDTDDTAPTLTASTLREYAAVTPPAAGAVPLRTLEALLTPNPSGQPPNLPHGYQFAPITVTTAAFDAQRPADPLALPILAYRPPQIRGTFSDADRAGAFTVHSAAGVQKLPVDTSPPGSKYSDPMPGEYESGWDAVDQHEVYNSGNYGVIYRFDITLVDDAATGDLNYRLLLVPSGGSGHYLAAVDGHTLRSPWLNYTQAWWYQTVPVTGGEAHLRLETSLVSGSAGPQSLLFAPGGNPA